MRPRKGDPTFNRPVRHVPGGEGRVVRGGVQQLKRRAIRTALELPIAGDVAARRRVAKAIPGWMYALLLALTRYILVAGISTPATVHTRVVRHEVFRVGAAVGPDT